MKLAAVCQVQHGRCDDRGQAGGEYLAGCLFDQSHTVRGAAAAAQSQQAMTTKVDVVLEAHMQVENVDGGTGQSLPQPMPRNCSVLLCDTPYVCCPVCVSSFPSCTMVL